ncbi:protein kinase domain-containing protein [Aliarcobacter lanthieri]|uniref:protein kinase domain-containing protein n=1 Tax=Aliarcobacter lanthieri TaxID=1355374 RepID=UPI003AAAEE06
MFYHFSINGKSFEIDDTCFDSFSNKYTILEHISGGGNSFIFKITDKREEKKYALKLLKYTNKKSLESFDEEIKLMTEFTRAEYADSFIAFISSGEIDVYEIKKARKENKRLSSKKHKFYIMELADKTIQNFLCNKTLSSEQEKIPYILKLAESLKYIHEKEYVHRDIKPQNILFKEEIPIISDFGLMVKEKTCLEKKGPKFWPTPEFLEMCETEHCAHKQTDIFQLGCIFFYIYTNKYPIGNVSFNEIPDNNLMKTVIKRMLSYKKEDRYENALELYDDIENILEVGIS